MLNLVGIALGFFYIKFFHAICISLFFIPVNIISKNIITLSFDFLLICELIVTPFILLLSIISLNKILKKFYSIDNAKYIQTVIGIIYLLVYSFSLVITFSSNDGFSLLSIYYFLLNIYFIITAVYLIIKNKDFVPDNKKIKNKETSTEQPLKEKTIIKKSQLIKKAEINTQTEPLLIENNTNKKENKNNIKNIFSSPVFITFNALLIAILLITNFVMYNNYQNTLSKLETCEKDLASKKTYADDLNEKINSLKNEVFEREEDLRLISNFITSPNTLNSWDKRNAESVIEDYSKPLSRADIENSLIGGNPVSK